MIVKMKFLTVTGPKDSLDQVIEEYLYKYEFQLENALTELNNVNNLKPFYGASPYHELYQQSEELLKLVDTTGLTDSDDITLDDAKSVLEKIHSLQEQYTTEQKSAEASIKKLNEHLTNLKPFKDFNYDIHEVLNFKFINHAFGRMPKEYYAKYEKYMEKDLDAVFIKCDENETFIWGAYFMPQQQSDKVDSLFASLHFEKYSLPDGYSGTASEIYAQIEQEVKQTQEHLEVLRQRFDENCKGLEQQLLMANRKLKRLSDNFDVRKMVACTQENHTDFFILCGWMPKEDARKFEKEIEADKDIFVVEDDNNSATNSQPPTKLHNFFLFRPFEMFVEMYGLPDYNEIDPTSFVALTYAFIFGIMFGDVGQGLCLVIGGFLLYKMKGMRLAAIISCAGIFSTIFGFMFGSVFGFENIIDPLWIRPGQAMINLPFIGNMNLVLVVAIAFGMFLILLTMLMHIINGIRAHKKGEIFFDTNAGAGFVFYLALVTVVVLFMTGNALPAGFVMLIMFGVPLILIALKEPLTNLVEKKKDLIEGGKGMFLVQTLFEMFEVLLSYVSNTISFVRIGAFAISHGAMMEVVLMLSGAESGSINWLIIILGNLIVCGLEGLIVGIQVLRLEYYEMFSRFYTGSGKAYRPFHQKA